MRVGRWATPAPERGAARRSAEPPGPASQVAPAADTAATGWADLGNGFTDQASSAGWCIRRSVDGDGCSGCGGACSGPEPVEDGGAGIQASLEVGAPDDPSEVQAEHIADQVVQRAAAPGAEEETPDQPGPDTQAQSAEVAASPPGENPILAQIDQLLAQDGIGRSASSGPTPAQADGVAAELTATAGGGAPLPATARNRMERAFGADFGAVRVHTDDRAAMLSRRLQAHAFTLGQDIYFGAGKFDPGSRDGSHLLAHELTHTVQQRSGRAPIRRLAITRNSFTPGNWGAWNVVWTFTLDKPAPTDGYLVQHVRQLATVAACPSAVNSISLTPTLEFWEAWRVRKGDKNDEAFAKDGYTDSTSRPPQPGTSGCQAALGTVKFFPIATTGDLGTEGTAPATPNGGWGPGNAPPSGVLTSTRTKPSWWSGTPGEGPASRWASAWWNNCGPVAGQFNKVDAKP